MTELAPKIEIVWNLWINDIKEEELTVNTQWLSEGYVDDEFVDEPEYIPSDFNVSCAKSNPTTCKYCNKNFCKPKAMYKHCRNVHKTEPELKRKPCRICPLCSDVSYDYNRFRTHLMKVHKKGLLKLLMRFKSRKGNFQTCHFNFIYFAGFWSIHFTVYYKFYT